MLSLIIIRHGETNWNAEKRIQGHTDIPLNAAGLKQAENLAAPCRVLRQIDPIPLMVFASPLQRALRTAQIALENTVAIQTDERLMEINYGTWSGLHIPTLWQEHPQECATWFARDDRSCCPHGGENWLQFRQRVVDFHQSVIEPHIKEEDMRILLFTHGGIISEYINLLLNASAVFATANTSITEILLNPAYPPMLKVFNYAPGVEIPFQWVQVNTNEFSKS